ncbi:3-oxoacyl-ACP synthase [Desulfatiferula olefinivorans]
MKTPEHPTPPWCVSGLGLVTAVGHDYKTACASIRAGLKRSTKLRNFYVPNPAGFEDIDDGLVTGHPVLGGDLDDRDSRIVTLLAMALSDLKADAGLDDTTLAGTRFYLALPDPGRGPFDEESLRERLRAIDAWPFSGETPLQLIVSGHAGMLVALSDAVTRGDIDRAVIAGADSLINFDDLSRLNAHERLRTALNPDGLIPGEAASAFLVEKTEAARKRKATIHGLIHAAATARESFPLAPGKPALGAGLAQAVTGALDSDNPSHIAAVFTDVNGEPCRFAEWSMVQTRALLNVPGHKEPFYPARNVGDTGAAGPGVAVCLATGMFGRSKDDRILILSSSDTGERGALSLGTGGTGPWPAD